MSIITVLDNAKDYLIKTCVSQNKPAIKLEVKGGGCAGFSYDYSFIENDQIDNMDEVVELDNQHKFVVDAYSVMYVIGTALDYEEKLGSTRLVLKNPNETSSCGCGKSFSVG